MVKTAASLLTYGNIKLRITEEILQEGIIKYLMGKNPHWTEEIFETVDWEAVGTYMRTISESRVTNILKIVHG